MILWSHYRGHLSPLVCVGRFFVDRYGRVATWTVFTTDLIFDEDGVWGTRPAEE